jgi:hypothetical protein
MPLFLHFFFLEKNGRVLASEVAEIGQVRRVAYWGQQRLHLLSLFGVLAFQVSEIPRSINHNVRNYNPRDKKPEFRRLTKTTVIPAKAGIQFSLDSRLRGNDDFIILPSVVCHLSSHSMLYAPCPVRPENCSSRGDKKNCFPENLDEHTRHLF